GIYGVWFAARPFGGLFFGTLGDRIGRRWVLVATIVLMGGSSTLIGILPTYEQAGILAPILLVVLRLAQGFGAGAEQAGATVLMAEYSPVKRRGFPSALHFRGHRVLPPPFSPRRSSRWLSSRSGRSSPGAAPR